MTHIRMTTGVIRRVEPDSLERDLGREACYRGELTAVYNGGRWIDYFPNYNFTLGRPEHVPLEPPPFPVDEFGDN